MARRATRGWRSVRTGLSCAAAVVLAACGGGAPSTSLDAGAPSDGGSLADGGARSTDGGASPDGGAPFDPGPEPTAPLRPVPGELTILHLDLPLGITVRMGEASVIVGPDGTLVLVDLGNSNHDDDVRDFVHALNTQHLTPTRGFPSRAPLQVEWVVLTHYHADHIGGAPGLLGGGSPLALVHGVVHRGLVDLGPGANEADVESLCGLLRDSLAAKDWPLCEAAAPAPCNPAQWSGTYPAAACAGLRRGHLGGSPSGAPTWLSLGAGARLTLAGADGFAVDAAGVTARAPFGTTDVNEENARSVVGVVSHGGFRYWFGGDLTGSGAATEPDVESHVVARTAPLLWSGLGVDVAHASHHARRTSSNAALVESLAPADGRSRSVVAGLNAAYLGSPHEEVVARWTGSARLGDGLFWTTHVAPGGATGAALVDADGPVIVQTIQGGRGYRVQAAGASLRSAAYRSLR